jgi:hypothetical protein
MSLGCSRMSPKRIHFIDGIGFTARFSQELRHLWEQLREEVPNVVADIQRTTRAVGDEVPVARWGIHFVPRTIVAPNDILMVDGLQVHILGRDRKLLRGKVVDFANHLLIVHEGTNVQGNQ